MSYLSQDFVAYRQILVGQLFDKRTLFAALNYVTMRGLEGHYCDF